MKRKYCLIAVAILFITSCQKEIEPFDDSGSTGTGTSISGTWNFVSLNGNTQSTQEYNESGTDYKTITYSNYTTINNTGTITFNDSTFNSANIGYYISSLLNGYDYENGVLVDSTQMPFSITIDSSNSTGKYELIGSDSIYFPQGSFVSVSGSQVQAEPSGAKYTLSGNTLTITQMVSKDTTQDILGIPYHTIEAGTFVISLQKQ